MKIMKPIHILTLSAVALFCLASCELKNELTGSLVDKDDTGALELNLSVKQPVSQTRADATGIDTNTFPVTIQGTSDGVTDVIYEYDALSEMPASITVPVGEYTVSSHTPGELQQQMTAPYYAGSTNVTVQKDIASVVNVVCRMANSRIQLNYGADFLEAFSSWTITINDGNEMALSYTQENLNPEAVFWHFGDNVTAITVNIRAVTTDGNTVTAEQTFRKADATENYEEVGENFTGGDALVIAMGTTESSTGDVTDITINTFITFEDESEAVEIPTVDDTPVPPTTSITISEPEGNSYLTDGVDLELGTQNYPEKDVVINMAIDNGIENLYVYVTTDNPTFETATGLMGLTTEPGMDLTSEEAIENNLNGLFTLPQKEDKTYSFTLNTGLLNLLMNTPGYAGTHNFRLTVVDKSGGEATGTLVVRVK